MTRLPIGHPARVIGMESASMIVGSVWRNGGLYQVAHFNNRRRAD